ncbi:hypothetical protein LO762_22890 [Actinocorallia sp. API 0066]|uniref:hypothetical protein n=1 Tax=Actinocorallia sp. API 0066 TaxID=2896846 RepID=UPI001E3D1D69|nr:hypothetical protein [Actinocorallia sp. API 0066]MCD0452016.1 hypothetical protein [Actinocorallia sp. API 0066]
MGFGVRYFDLDPGIARERLRGLGARCHRPRRLIQRIALAGRDGSWAGLHSEGDRHVLTLMREQRTVREVLVSDFDAARDILEGLGLRVTGRQETHREGWELHGVEFRFAEGPGLAPSLEIHGPEEQAVRWALGQLGLDPGRAQPIRPGAPALGPARPPNPTEPLVLAPPPRPRPPAPAVEAAGGTMSYGSHPEPAEPLTGPQPRLPAPQAPQAPQAPVPPRAAPSPPGGTALPPWPAQPLAHPEIPGDPAGRTTPLPPPPPDEPVAPVTPVDRSARPAPLHRAPEPEAEADPGHLVQFAVTETGWTSEASEWVPGEYWIRWATVLHNPNTLYWCELPTVQITVRDEYGKVIGTEEQVLTALPPRARIAWAGLLEITGSRPHTLEITPRPADWYPTPSRPEDFPPFGYENVSMELPEGACEVTGEIRNPYPVPVEEVALVALFRDGRGTLISGDMSFVQGLPAGGTAAFKIEGTVPEPPGPVVSLDLVALPWSESNPWETALHR